MKTIRVNFVFVNLQIKLKKLQRIAYLCIKKTPPILLLRNQKGVVHTNTTTYIIIH